MLKFLHSILTEFKKKIDVLEYNMSLEWKY